VQVQLPRTLGGLNAGAVYIGTESSLATIRLNQIASSLTDTLTISPPPGLPDEDIEHALRGLATHGDRIYYYNCSDLETQEHIVTYQLPVMLQRFRVGLVILDSVTANYRAEFERPPPKVSTHPSPKRSTQAAQMAHRSKDLRNLAGTLKYLAIEYNVAVVAINQVTDTFKKSSQTSIGTPQDGDAEFLSLDYQARWFEGAADQVDLDKKPALGLVWANLITSRVMLVRDSQSTRIKVVFSPFAPPGSVEYGISPGKGVHAIEHEEYDLQTDEIAFSDIDLSSQIHPSNA
jgi:DNA repair protein RAD57